MSLCCSVPNVPQPADQEDISNYENQLSKSPQIQIITDKEVSVN